MVELSIFGTVSGWIGSALSSILGYVGISLTLGLVILVIIAAMAPSFLNNLLAPLLGTFGTWLAKALEWLAAVLIKGIEDILDTWQTWLTVVILCMGTAAFVVWDYGLNECPACPKCPTVHGKVVPAPVQDNSWFFQRWWSDVFG